ncbi:hypothetical protein RA210_U30225 [Rubrivivax sp. A210]|nr:hypothetical protein RA210_U30225 [Rubrivivax sp. A210]
MFHRHQAQPAKTSATEWHAAAGARVRFIEAFVTLAVLVHLTGGMLQAVGLV